MCLVIVAIRPFSVHLCALLCPIGLPYGGHLSFSGVKVLLLTQDRRRPYRVSERDYTCPGYGKVWVRASDALENKEVFYMHVIIIRRSRRYNVKY